MNKKKRFCAICREKKCTQDDLCYGCKKYVCLRCQRIFGTHYDTSHPCPKLTKIGRELLRGGTNQTPDAVPSESTQKEGSDEGIFKVWHDSTISCCEECRNTCPHYEWEKKAFIAGRHSVSTPPSTDAGRELAEREVLLDNCYDAICEAIYSEDGLDGVDGELLCKTIEDLIGETPTIKKWKSGNEEPLPSPKE